MNQRPQLRMVFWELTAGCNLACIHCRRLDVSKELSKRDLSHEDSLEVIRQIASLGPSILVLSGGEPLMRPDVFDLARFARANGLEVALATNGTLVNGEVAEKIHQSGIRRVAISLDGPSAHVHDAFRKEEGAFERALNGCRELKKAGVSLQINTTLTQHNEALCDEIYQLALNLGADAFHLFMLVPVGCGLQIAQTHQVNAEKYEEILMWLYQKSLEGKIHVRATCAPHYFRIIRQRAIKEKRTLTYAQKGMHAMTRGCLAGSSISFVSHQGDVFPCGYLPVSAGKVPETSFDEIWNTSSVFQTLRDPSLLEGKCGICEFKKVCMGCRARAFYKTGNFMQEEPFCAYS
ncbi:MAG: radical SAM protein, partial [Chlamydiae bacterium]|nr:radical SAM protein [Chlamydiota bacterium]